MFLKAEFMHLKSFTYKNYDALSLAEEGLCFILSSFLETRSLLTTFDLCFVTVQGCAVIEHTSQLIRGVKHTRLRDPAWRDHRQHEEAVVRWTMPPCCLQAESQELSRLQGWLAPCCLGHAAGAP